MHLGFPQYSKTQTNPFELYTKMLACHVLVCGTMYQIEPIFYDFHQPNH
jgi:hypothetical protein